MRPGPIGPGNEPQAAVQRQRVGGFNEARPNWAGKCLVRSLAGSEVVASMRPGPIGPGNPGRITQPNRLPTLQ